MLLALFTVAALATFGQSQSANFLPVASYYDSVSEETQVSSSLNLNAVGKTLILDYGSEVAGVPYFVVEVLGGPTQVEVKYTEELSGLDFPNSDGPFPFSSGLSNTFRVETFNFTSPGPVNSFFIQGGQRWQSITQLTEGHITFSEIGLLPSIIGSTLR